MAVRDQVMSSTERAPEPTMEEILASIRRIISDDETNAARARPASAQQQEDETAETVEIEADDAIINDIARVLSESAPKVEDEEDILDLTAELGTVKGNDYDLRWDDVLRGDFNADNRVNGTDIDALFAVVNGDPAQRMHNVDATGGVAMGNG